MAITQAMATSFKVQILNGQQNFTSNTFKLALYTSAANLDQNTTVYTTSNEVASAGNYTAGGNTLTVSVTPTNSGNVAYISYANTSWANATITAAGALIYNANLSNAAVCVLSFGGDKTSTNGTFAVNFPTADSNNAIIRLTAS
jgi:hypothetical protein